MTPTTTSNAVLLERIENVGSKVDDVANTLKEHNQREMAFSERYNVAHSQVVNSTNQAHIRIDDLDKQIKANKEAIDQLRQAIQPLIYTNKILTWLAILMGGSIFALIWAILTHTVTIVIP